MAYEHQKEVNDVAEKAVDILDALTDDVPDQQQVARLFGDATGVITGLMAGVKMEQKPAFKAKFFGKVGAAISNRSLDKFLPDSES